MKRIRPKRIRKQETRVRRRLSALFGRLAWATAPWPLPWLLRALLRPGGPKANGRERSESSPAKPAAPTAMDLLAKRGRSQSGKSTPSTSGDSTENGSRRR